MSRPENISLIAGADGDCVVADGACAVRFAFEYQPQLVDMMRTIPQVRFDWAVEGLVRAVSGRP